MVSCCNASKKHTKCTRKTDKKIFKLPRKFSKKQCKNPRGFTMKSSCAPYDGCKNMKGGKKYKYTKKKKKKRDKIDNYIGKIIKRKYKNKVWKWLWIVKKIDDKKYRVRFAKRNILLNKLDKKHNKDYKEEEIIYKADIGF